MNNLQKPYIEEHKRLGNLILESGKIWEERTYQIAAGGLSITFAVFTFLSKNNVFAFDWHMGLIWALYAWCILSDYISHQISVRKMLNMQKFLEEQRKQQIPYDEDSLNDKYRKSDRFTYGLNISNTIILTGNVVYTLIYTVLRLAK